jgi:hypothetical protein
MNLLCQMDVLSSRQMTQELEKMLAMLSLNACNII